MCEKSKTILPFSIYCWLTSIQLFMSFAFYLLYLFTFLYHFQYFRKFAFRGNSHFAKIRISHKFAFCENSHFAKIRISHKFAFRINSHLATISHNANFSHAKILFAFCENYANLKSALRCDANAKFRKIFASHANFAKFACESTSLRLNTSSNYKELLEISRRSR